ncbi:hypothetical protein CcCBS67573_g07458 [Chytriomyces confervae]|uniref:Pre-rRNA-processing protein TSR2 n=1 Tax=Chytriomyces confervae TaxID=246404 RepID=A0A507EUR1_9FUNG|nr:hypothetical protein CcCBS67573_g07458 [Chytriomyces confervae]
MGTSDKRPTNVSTCTTPTTTAAKKGACGIGLNKNSSSSHGKKPISESTGIAASTAKSEKDVKMLREQAEARLMNTWSSIFEKYGRDLSAESDEIDVRTGEIVVDNGFHRNCKYVPFGRALYDADDADEDEDDDEEEEEEDEEYDEDEIENDENCESRAAAAAAPGATDATAKTAGKLIENGDHSERAGSANMLSAISKRKNLMTSHAPISFEELGIPQTPSQGSFQKLGVKTASATTPTPISTAAFKKSMKTPSVKSTTKSLTECSTPPHQEPRTPNGPSKNAANEPVSDSFEASQNQTPDFQPSIPSSAVSAPKVDCTPSGVGDTRKDLGMLTAVRKCVSTKKPAPRNRLGSSVIGKLQKKSKDAVTLMSSPLGKHSFVVIENPQHLALFNESIHYVFLRWTALQLAIEHGMGGSQTLSKVSLLGTYITDFFGSQGVRIDSYDLEDNLISYFEESFQAQLEDGSALQVSQLLVALFRELGDGRLDTFERCKTAALNATANTGASVRVRDDDESSDGDSDSDSGDESVGAFPSGMQESEGGMEVEMAAEPVVKQGPVFDEDGFEVVQQKGRRRR